MKRFRFRPERLLRLRRQTLSMERMRLGDALRALQRAQRDWELGRKASEQASEDLFRLLGGTPSGQEIGARLLVLAETRRRLAHLAAQREQAKRRADDQRHRVVETHRAVRVLELLREKRLAEHRRELLREEARLLDEVASSGFWRGRFGGIDSRSSARGGG